MFEHKFLKKFMSVHYTRNKNNVLIIKEISFVLVLVKSFSRKTIRERRFGVIQTWAQRRKRLFYCEISDGRSPVMRKCNERLR